MTVYVVRYSASFCYMTGITHGTILVPLRLTIQINNLPPRTNTSSDNTIFSEDSSVTISSHNVDNLSSVSNTVLPHMGKEFVVC